MVSSVGYKDFSGVDLFANFVKKGEHLRVLA